jgi:hypothetical protein
LLGTRGSEIALLLLSFCFVPFTYSICFVISLCSN